jgi:hypothetical protein
MACILCYKYKKICMHISIIKKCMLTWRLEMVLNKVNTFSAFHFSFCLECVTRKAELGLYETWHLLICTDCLIPHRKSTEVLLSTSKEVRQRVSCHQNVLQNIVG